MKECAEERKKHLEQCFWFVLSSPPGSTVIFGGDLNTRDSDLASTEGIQDMWIQLGIRKEVEFTWDMQRYYNLELVATSKYKPRLRFDRLYIRHGADKAVRLLKFELVGLVKVAECQKYPSDHFGIKVWLQIKPDEEKGWNIVRRGRNRIMSFKI